MTMRLRPSSRVHFSVRRRQNGVALADISRRTKIPLLLLEDLEKERFDRFPPGIFARAYVRAYAEEACLDVDVVLARVIRKLPGDETLSDVSEVIGDTTAPRRPAPSPMLPFPRLRHVTTILAAAVILVALAIRATQPGASVGMRFHQLMAPPLTNAELAATAPLYDAEAQPVATSGTRPTLVAVDDPDLAGSGGVFPSPDSGALSRRGVGVRNSERVTTRRIANHKSESRLERVFSGVGGVFKKLFTGDDDDKRGNGRRR
jgi:hypothetical protein